MSDKADKRAEKAKPAKAMPVWVKAPAELAAFFKAIIVDYPQAEPRMMFGYPCALVNGYLTTGVFGDKMFVKLDAAAAQELLDMPGAAVMEPSPGHKMAGLIFLPEDIRTSPEVHTWLRRSIDYTAALPPKVKKQKVKKQL